MDARGYVPHVDARAFEELVAPPPPLLTHLRRALAFKVSLAQLGPLRWRAALSRSTLLADFVAAVTVAVVIVPQGMAYAKLAGLPPIYGLWASSVPLLIFALITSSSQVAPGPVAPTALLMLSIVSALSGAPPMTDTFVHWHIVLAFVTGVAQLALALLNVASWVSDLLSFPVMSGFTLGAALIILVSQARDILGLPDIAADPFFFTRLSQLLHALPNSHGPTIAVSAISALLLAAKFVHIRGRSLPRGLPLPLIVIIGGAAVGWAADLPALGIENVGGLPVSLPSFAVPLRDVGEFMHALPSSLLLAVINYVQTFALAVAFGKKVGERIAPLAELYALGASCVVGSFFSCYAIAGSFTRTGVQAQAGARTPLATFGTGVIILLFLASGLTRLLSRLPQACLAVIVVASALPLVGDSAISCRALWRTSRVELAVLLLTALFVLLGDLVLGLVEGVALSLVVVLLRGWRPRFVELARLPGTDSFVARDRFPDAEAVPGIILCRIDGPLHFGNITVVTSSLTALVDDAKLKADIARASVAAEATAPEAAGAQPVHAVLHEAPAAPSSASGEVSPTRRFAYALVGHSARRRRRRAASSAQEPTASSSFLSGVSASSPSDGSVLGVHVDRDHPSPGIVVDGSRVSDVDATAARALCELLDAAEEAGVLVLVAALPGVVRDTLASAAAVYGRAARGDAHRLWPPDVRAWSFLSVSAAVSFLEAGEEA